MLINLILKDFLKNKYCRFDAFLLETFMSLTKRVSQREFQNKPPLKFEADNISRKEYVDAIHHSATLKGHTGCVNTICWNKCGS